MTLGIAAAHRQHNAGVPAQRGEHERLPETLKEITHSLQPIRDADPAADIAAMAVLIRRENRLANRGRRPAARHQRKTTNIKKIRFAARRAMAVAARMSGCGQAPEPMLPRRIQKSIATAKAMHPCT